jgi:hypothetical protein
VPLVGSASAGASGWDTTECHEEGPPRWQSPDCHCREHHEEAPPCCTQGWICRATSLTCR